MSEQVLPMTGGCRCGRLRIEVSEAPLLASACHCTGCQRMTASAFSLTLSVPASGFRVTVGETVIGGLHGPEAHHHHCDHCKSWVYTTAEDMDWFVNVRPTMLDDAGAARFAPYMEVWTSEKLPFAATGAPRSYETQPGFDEYEDLMTEYRAWAGA